MAERVILPPAVAGQVIADFDSMAHSGESSQLRPPTLADRERFALEQLRDAVPVEQTAEQVGSTPATLHNLAASAVFKLHRHARSEAVLYTVADRVYGF
jgi:hypothetical protein